MIIFGHGYQTSIGYYDYLWQAIVPQGYLMVLSDTQNALVWNFNDFGLDLAFLADQMQAEDANPASLFYGRIDAATAIMGHSMGGGATFIAGQLNPRITTVVGLAPSAVDSGVIDAAAQAQAACLVLAGSEDCIVPASSHAPPIYNAVPVSPKYYAQITEGSHCAFAQDARLCEIAEWGMCPFPDFLTDSTQRALTLLFVQPWLDATLKGRSDAGGAVLE